MIINYLLVVLIASLTEIILISWLRKIALRYNLLISNKMLLVGGVSMGISFIFACLLGFFFFGGLSQSIIAIIIASFIMLIFGIIDDLFELSVFAKFIVQIIAISLLILFGVRTEIVHIGSPINIIITFIWILAITNAFNHLDVIDGLAAGIATIVSSTFFIISLLNNDINSSILSLSLAAISLFFLFFNFPPARIYMGNSGSHFLGFVLAIIALVISYAPLERKIALLTPLFVLGFPILDTGFLILIRIYKKNLPFRKSNDHLVLRILSLGYSKRKALLIMLAWGIFFSLSGLIVSQASIPFVIVISIFLAMVNLILIAKLSKVKADG